MKLLHSVKKETLEKLLCAAVDVMNEMKQKQPDFEKRTRDEFYELLLRMNCEIFDTIRKKEQDEAD